MYFVGSHPADGASVKPFRCSQISTWLVHGLGGECQTKKSTDLGAICLTGPDPRRIAAARSAEVYCLLNVNRLFKLPGEIHVIEIVREERHTIPGCGDDIDQCETISGSHC